MHGIFVHVGGSNASDNNSNVPEKGGILDGITKSARRTKRPWGVHIPLYLSDR